MKNLLIALILMIIGSDCFSQEYMQSSFYKSFSRHLNLHNTSQYRGYNGFHSVLLRTNDKGQVISYTSSESMTESIKKDIDRAFKGSDKDGLMDFNLRSRTIYLPIIILSMEKVPDSRLEEMWKFRNFDNSVDTVVILPPIVYILRNKTPIVN